MSPTRAIVSGVDVLAVQDAGGRAVEKRREERVSE